MHCTCRSGSCCLVLMSAFYSRAASLNPRQRSYLDAIALAHRSRCWGKPYSFRHHRRCQSESRYVYSAVRLELVLVSGDLRCATEPNLPRSVTIFAAEFRGADDHYLRASDFDGAVAALT